MKVKIINFETEFKMRKNKDNTGTISYRRGLIILNEVGFDQICALNSHTEFQDVVDEMFSIYDADKDTIEKDLRSMLHKLQDNFGIRHKYFHD